MSPWVEGSIPSSTTDYLIFGGIIMPLEGAGSTWTEGAVPPSATWSECSSPAAAYVECDVPLSAYVKCEVPVPQVGGNITFYGATLLPEPGVGSVDPWAPCETTTASWTECDNSGSQHGLIFGGIILPIEGTGAVWGEGTIAPSTWTKPTTPAGSWTEREFDD